MAFDHAVALLLGHTCTLDLSSPKGQAMVDQLAYIFMELRNLSSTSLLLKHLADLFLRSLASADSEEELSVKHLRIIDLLEKEHSVCFLTSAGTSDVLIHSTL